MTHVIDLAQFGAAKASDRKALALVAYDSAKADSAVANWEAVADMLRACMPATAVKIPGAPTWWRDYEVKGFAALKRAQKEMVEFEFADGRTIRSAALSLPTKGFNIGRAARLAIAFYRVRAGEGAPVPEFVRVYWGGRPAGASISMFNTMTESLRAEGGGMGDVAHGVEDRESRIAKVEAELERRKGRRELSAILGAMAVRVNEEKRERSAYLRRLTRGLRPSELAEIRDGMNPSDTIKQEMRLEEGEWSMAIQAGERELAKLRLEPKESNS